MQLSFFTWVLALLPVIVVLVLMLALRWGGSKAGALAWFVAVAVAMLFFGAGPGLIAYAQVKAILLSLDVLYIIWTALLLFHIADEAGAVATIGLALPRLTGNRTMQALLLGWLFTSFLQGMGGFGVPVAVAAPLLVSLGFSPVNAVVMACIGHGWAVNFGSMATSFQTLLAVTGLPGELLAPESAILLGLAALPCGMIVAYVAGSWKNVLRSMPALLILSLVMGLVQYLLVTNGVWTLGATGAAMAGMLAGVALTRLPIYNHAPKGEAAPPAVQLPAAGARQVSLALALSAYIVLIVLAFGINLVAPIERFLGQFQYTLYFPEMRTAFGWVTPAEAGRYISLLSHPGAILLYSSIVSYLVYRRAGCYQPGALRRITWRVAQGAVNSSLGIVAMVGLSVVMSHSGMTNMLAMGLSQAFGAALYPLAAPFIGALGAFITGSNNNSNVLFAALQQRTAELLGLSVSLILASQTAGGSLGSIIAPAKVIVGVSTVGLVDRESTVMGKLLVYGLLPVLFVAVLTLVMAWW
ncbi:MAG TPA: L-lactate permease [Levilinea sp.]|nr:L-lactate permease [Levilinea sp.]